MQAVFFLFIAVEAGKICYTEQDHLRTEDTDMELDLIRAADPKVAEAIELELNRQRTHIELIAS